MGKTQKRTIELPVMNVQLLPIEKVKPNDYNPNKMQHKILKLLKTSIIEDGFLFPILVIHDKRNDEYVVVDGFHRYKAMTQLKQTHIPAVVLKRDISERRIMTVRMNKTRGVHQLEGDKQNFQNLVDEDKYSLSELSEKMALEAEEIVIYKKKGSIIEEYRDEHDFSNAWERDQKANIMYKNKEDYNEYDEDEL